MWTTGHEINIARDLNSVGNGGTFYLSSTVMSVIHKLCADIKIEWQMLLIGEVKEGNAHITDYWIPKQEVSHTSIHNLDIVDKKVIAEKGIVATIHSHGDMAVFCSDVDDEFTNLSLIQRHIVVNNNIEFHAVTTWYLPNGDAAFLKANVQFETPVIDKVEGIDNITKRAIVKPTKRKHGLITDYTKDDFPLVQKNFLQGGLDE